MHRRREGRRAGLAADAEVRGRTMKTWITAAALAVAALSALADEHGSRTPPLSAYQSECGSCHVAFPARGLPASSWQHLMGGLGKHFGTDASLDAATTKAIGDWLQA